VEWIEKVNDAESTGGSRKDDPVEIAFTEKIQEVAWEKEG